MDVTIHTSDPDAVDPAEIAAILQREHYLVLSVMVVDRTPDGGSRVWDADVEGAARLGDAA